MIGLSVKVPCMPAISAAPEEKTDLLDIGNDLVDEVNLISLKLEA